MSFVIVGAAVGVAGSIAKSNEEAAKQEAAIKINREGGKLKFKAITDSSNIMKAANREQTANAMQEVLRVGAANEEEVAVAVNQGISKMVASGEGLTSGRSKGRAMISLQVEGNKAIQGNTTETSSMLNQLVESQDKITNDINNQLFAAHVELQNILSNRGSSINGTGAAISAGISGAVAAKSLAS